MGQAEVAGQQRRQQRSLPMNLDRLLRLGGRLRLATGRRRGIGRDGCLDGDILSQSIYLNPVI